MAAESFTVIRLISGAAALVVIIALRHGRRLASIRQSVDLKRGVFTAAALFAYAFPFAYAYESLSAGTGALVLFGVVQGTIVIWGLIAGERLGRIATLGFVTAGIGLVVLVAPGVERPSLTGAGLMACAGVAWGVYTLLGRSSKDPVVDTGISFLGAAIVAGVALLVGAVEVGGNARGVGLAVTSGAVTSGLGYAIWYAALRGLTRLRAALLQLTVPILTSAGGVLLLGEGLSVRLIIASVLVLGGIGIALRARAK